MVTEIRNHLGEKIDFTYLEGEESLSDWIVILGHGVTGNKDRPVVAETTAALNGAGFRTLAFSFSGNGESEGDFRDSCVSKGIGDLTAVIKAVEDKKIIYLGHSMGGAIGVLTAARDDRILRLVSLAGMVNTKRFALTEFGEETPNVGCMWEEESCPLSQAFMDDLCQTIGTVIEEAENVKVPWLLIHGTEDDVVLPQDSIDIKERLGDRVQHVMIAGADHSFGGDHRKAQLDAVVNWLQAVCD
ncbi:MAG: alpha/beta fold hydrolase [Verrucomicrobia bacterium]|nr:alpha/beta fold hydrolase [Verrucomicrobiota bacterium]MDA1065881.1 alpha/beta fold hydrolase [Verrucomicrobiota bacterium]